MSIRVRFAPSPTGYLHLGGLRTALFNFLYAKNNNGKVILRIEDTDQTRKVDDAVDSLMEIFNKMGISFDESPNKEGNLGPYIQSKRLKTYKKFVDILLKDGSAYPCFCTSKRLDELRLEMQSKNQSTKYDRYCLNLTEQEIEKKISSEPHVIRLKVPNSKFISFNDLIRGKITFNTEEIDDQVLMKSDGFPTYHLANVVDDFQMKISKVIRGEEWLSSTPKHIILYKAFGWDIPQFAHVPLLLNSDKSKLSKRQGDVAVEDYLQKGILPEALINFIVLLGWNPGYDREIFSLDELISEFSLDRINISGAVFDKEKLYWMNSQYLKSLSLDRIVEYSISFISFDINKNDKKYMKAIDFIRRRISRLSELESEIKYFYQHNLDDHPDASIIDKKDSQAVYKYWSTSLSRYEKLSLEEINSLISKTSNELGIKGIDLFFPLRLAIYGECKGPDIGSVYNILGHKETIRRINTVINK